jgi:hypothetical protein
VRGLHQRKKKQRSLVDRLRPTKLLPKPQQLFLPGTLLMAIGAKLLATFMFIDFCFPTFF